MNDSQSTFLLLSASFSSTSCCFPSGITLKIVAFKVEASWLCCCVHSRKKKWQYVFFPPSVTPLSTILWSRAVMFPEQGTIDRFHMTSRRPYFCTKQWIGGSMFVYKKDPVGIELFSRVKTFFYSKQRAKLLTTWLKTIYCSNASGYIWF